MCLCGIPAWYTIIFYEKYAFGEGVIIQDNVPLNLPSEGDLPIFAFKYIYNILELKVNASQCEAWNSVYVGMRQGPCYVTGDGFSLEKAPQMSKSLSYIPPFFSLIGKRCQDKIYVWSFLFSWQRYVNMLLWGQHLWLWDLQESRCGRFGSHNRQGHWKWIQRMGSSLREKTRQLPLSSREQLSWNNETPVTCRGILKE